MTLPGATIPNRAAKPFRLRQEEAAVYAALTAPGGRGDVYEVEPIGELESDAAAAPGTASYAAPAATVVTVIRRGVPVEEAAAQMRAFVLMLESAKRADLEYQLKYGISVEDLI